MEHAPLQHVSGALHQPACCTMLWMAAGGHVIRVDMATNELSVGLDRTLSFLSDVRHINNHADLTTAVKRATATFGVEKILAGFIPKTGTLPSEQLRHVLLSDWPEDWATIYFQKGLLFQDPTIRRILRTQPTFAWSELTNEPDFGKNERFVMASAADFSLRNGCTVPLLSLDGRHVGFSFAGSHIDDSPEAKGVMTLIASFAFGRAVELRNNELRAKVRLTAREILDRGRKDRLGNRGHLRRLRQGRRQARTQYPDEAGCGEPRACRRRSFPPETDQLAAVKVGIPLLFCLILKQQTCSNLLGARHD